MIPLVRVAAALLAAAALVGAAPPRRAPPCRTWWAQALDAAKTTLVTAGFASYPQDLLRDRNPLLDSAWTVCRPSPGPTTAAPGSTVDLGVVKKVEACPDDGAVADGEPIAARPAAAIPDAASMPHAKPAPTAGTAAHAPGPRAATGAHNDGTAHGDATRSAAAARRTDESSAAVQMAPTASRHRARGNRGQRRGQRLRQQRLGGNGSGNGAPSPTDPRDWAAVR